MDMKVIEPVDTFVEFNDFDIKELYREYVKTYKKIHKYANFVRKTYKNTDDKEKLKERKIVYDAEKEMLEILIKLESYLPYKERYYTIKELNKLLKLTYNKLSSVGFVPIDYKLESIEEIIQNKILQNELLRMMKEILTKKQYSYMYMYFFNRMTQDEIAKKVNKTQQNIGEVLENAIVRIRNSEYLSSFLKNIK